MNIIVATSNPRKLEEIADLFADSEFRLLSLRDVGIEGKADEDGPSLTVNAFKKASLARQRYAGDAWVVADDTGLSIHALHGAPGVRTSRWAGENATAHELAQHCINEMRGIDDRRATFATVVAAISPSGDHFRFEGRIEGVLLDTMPVEIAPHTPLGSLFIPKGDTRTFAQMPIDDENAISHRGQAFRKFRAFLENRG